VPKNDVTNFAPYFLDPVIVRDARAVGIYTLLGKDPTAFPNGTSGTIDLTQARLDILDAINIAPSLAMTTFPLLNAAGTEGVTGDVIRVDPSDGTAPVPAGIFPNGRALGPDATTLTGPLAANQESDVTDIELSLLLVGELNTLGSLEMAGKPAPISDGVNSNDANYKTSIPYLATPWEGWSQGHGKAAP
jgi:hypothetical protein